MITQQENRNVKKIGVFNQETQFQIRNTAKAFRVFVGNLYSDKVGAIIREISANAYDAHVEAGVKEPFEVTLPSQFEPTFVLRDFGNSMSHDFMMGDYTAAFYSTKDKSNDFNGALGLGRLALLSLCDSYNCECFQNGTKRSYSIYINEHGIPSILFLGEEKTDEKNGFLVESAVPPNLYQDFESKAKAIYKNYKTRPIIKNRDDFVIPDETYLILAEDGSFGLKGSSSESVAIMGTYAYPIDYNVISGLTDIQEKLLKSGLITHFNLGELDIQPSREGLHYNKQTIENIKKKLDSIIPLVKPIVLKNFEGKNLFEKMELQNDLFAYEGKLSGLNELCGEFVKELKIPTFVNFEDFTVTVFTNGYKRRSYQRKVVKKQDSKNVSFEKNIVYFICDKKSYLQNRAKKYFEVPGNESKQLVFLYPLTNKSISDFKAEHGIDLNTFDKSSTLAFDKPGITGTGENRKVVVFTGWYRRTKPQEMWEADEIDYQNQDDLLYVERKGYGLEDGQSLERLDSRIKEFKKFTGNETVKIYGLNARQIAKKQKNWKTFDAAYKEEIKKWSDDNNENIRAYKYYQNKYSEFPQDTISKLDLTEDCLLNSIYQEWKELKKISDKIDHGMAGVSNLKESDNYEYSTNTLKSKYPLVCAIEWNQRLNSKIIAELSEYVRNKNLTIDS